MTELYKLQVTANSAHSTSTSVSSREEPQREQDFSNFKQFRSFPPAFLGSTAMAKFLLIAVGCCCLASAINANDPYSRGQGYGGGGYQDDYGYDKPAQYEYGYQVQVPPGKSYGGGDGYGKYGAGATWDSSEFGQSEKRYGDRTDGKYFVRLPDGRLQVVDYSVDGYSGYVANVRYEGGDRAYGGGRPQYSRK